MAVLQRVLRRQERHDPLARHIRAEVRDEMSQVVFLVRSDRAVGQEDERALAREPAHGVVGVDPGVHALARGELRERRPELCGEDRAARSKRGHEVGHGQVEPSGYYTLAR